MARSYRSNYNMRQKIGILKAHFYVSRETL